MNEVKQPEALRLAAELSKWAKDYAPTDFEEDMVLGAAEQIRDLHAANKAMRLALERAHSWMDGQARAQSKGCHSTFDLLMLRNERDEIANVLAATGAPV